MPNRLDNLPTDVLDLVYDFVGKETLTPIAVMLKDLNITSLEKFYKKFNERYIQQLKYDKTYTIDEGLTISTNQVLVLLNHILNKDEELYADANFDIQYESDNYEIFELVINNTRRMKYYFSCDFDDFKNNLLWNDGITSIISLMTDKDIKRCLYNQNYNGGCDIIRDRADDDGFLDLVIDKDEVLSIVSHDAEYMNEIMNTLPLVVNAESLDLDMYIIECEY